MLRTVVIFLIVCQLLLRSLAAAHEHSHELLWMHGPVSASGLLHLHLHTDDHHHHHHDDEPDDQPGGDDQESGHHDDCTNHHDCLIRIEEQSIDVSSTGTQAVQVITQATLIATSLLWVTLPTSLKVRAKRSFTFSFRNANSLPELPLALRI